AGCSPSSVKRRSWRRACSPAPARAVTAPRCCSKPAPRPCATRRSPNASSSDVRHLTPHELQQWLSDATREDPLLLDVREAWETALYSLPHCLHIPMQNVAERQDELLPH